MCVSSQGQTVTSHQPFHPGLCVSLSRGRLPPVINHSTLAYVCHYPGADCHQSSTIPPWPMCVTIQGQTATSHQPFHPGLCVSLSRGRLPPVINHSTLAYVWHYPGADCHQSSTIPPWPMCGRLPPVINHSTLAYVCHYPGADCHQSSTIPPWPMCVTIQGRLQTATIHQPFHPGLCVSLSRCRLPPVINHSTLAYVCHYPGPATIHQPFHPGLCVSLSRARLSRLRLTEQSLKRVGHEGKPCLKGEQRHPPCLRKVPLSYPAWGNRCHQNRVHDKPITCSIHVYRSVHGVHTSRPLIHTTPQAPLNHSGVCLCDLMFGQLQV